MKTEIDYLDYLVGQKLKEKRQQKRYSLQSVADYLQTSKSTIYYYEEGKTSMKLSTFIKYCGFLGLDYIEIMENARKEYYK